MKLNQITGGNKTHLVQTLAAQVAGKFDNPSDGNTVASYDRNEGWSFQIGDIDQATQDRMEPYLASKGIKVYTAYGDDLMNTITIPPEVDVVDDVIGQFILTCSGLNCYSSEDVIDPELDNDDEEGNL